MGGEVALTRPARPGQDEAAVLEQEADVVLHHGFGDESLEHQAVDAFLLQSWRGGDATINMRPPCKRGRLNNNSIVFELC